MTTREEFEAWLKTFGAACTSLEVRDGLYVSALTQSAWRAWQGSRNAYLEEAAKECDLICDAKVDLDAAYVAKQCAMGIRALKGE